MIINIKEHIRRIRMKKKLLVLFMTIMSLGLVACGGAESEDTSTSQTSQAETEAESESEAEVSEESETEPSQEETEAEEESETEADQAASNSESKKVVAGTVAVAELLDVLEYDNVIGVPVTNYELPDRYADAAPIGQPMEPDMEIVKSLDPDLFISVESLEEANNPKLEQHNIEYLFVNLDSIENIQDSGFAVGQAVEKEEEAEEFVADMDFQVEEIVSKTEGKDQPRVLFLFDSPRNIMLGTENSYVGSLIETLGAYNVAKDIVPGTDESYLPINMENIVTQDIDLILRMTHAAPEESRAMFEQEFQNEVWQSMDAVQEGNVIDLENGLFSVSGGINCIEALDRLYEHIYE